MAVIQVLLLWQGYFLFLISNKDMKVACTQQDSVKCKAVGYCYAKYIKLPGIVR